MKNSFFALVVAVSGEEKWEYAEITGKCSNENCATVEDFNACIGKIVGGYFASGVYSTDTASSFCKPSATANAYNVTAPWLIQTKYDQTFVYDSLNVTTTSSDGTGTAEQSETCLASLSFKAFDPTDAKGAEDAIKTAFCDSTNPGVPDKKYMTSQDIHIDSRSGNMFSFAALETGPKYLYMSGKDTTCSKYIWANTTVAVGAGRIVPDSVTPALTTAALAALVLVCVTLV